MDGLKMKRAALLVLTAAVLAGCSNSGQVATKSTPMQAPQTMIRSYADVATPSTSAPPTPEDQGYRQVLDSTQHTFWVKVGQPMAVTVVDQHPVAIVGFPVSILGGTSTVEFDPDSMDFDGKPLPFQYLTASWIPAACGATPHIRDAGAAVQATFTDTIGGGDRFQVLPAQPITGCVVWEEDLDTRPTSLTYGVGVWSGTLPAYPPAPAPTVLGTWSGNGSRLIAIPPAAQQGNKTCWNMPGGGNHIIETEADTAGKDLRLLTNTLGSPDVNCTDSRLDAFVQILAEDSWTLTVTNF
jgi:hypothetical protein